MGLTGERKLQRNASGVQPRARVRILVIEDERPFLRALRLLLNRFGEVVVAETAASARTALGSSHDWGLIMVDVGLPDGNGLHVLAEARAAGCTSPAIILTGRFDGGTINRAAQMDDVVFLAKPLPWAELAEHVARALAPVAGVDAAVEDYVARCELSPREAEVLWWKAHGLSDDEVCLKIHIDPGTLRHHREHILKKFHDHKCFVGVVKLTLERAVLHILLGVLGVKHPG